MAFRETLRPLLVATLGMLQSKEGLQGHRSLDIYRPFKFDLLFIVTGFSDFDEGGRSIFNIQYQ